MLITYAYVLNKNKKILEIIAPKYPKKFSITLSSVNLPKPGSFKSWLKRLIVINIPDNMKVEPKNTLKRNNLNPPYFNIIIVSNTFRIR